MSVCDPAETPAAVSDDDVMACVKAGSVVAFGVLYDRYHDQAYRVAWSVCRDAGCAQEAVEEAFILIWKARMTYDRQVGEVAPWVLTVARYRAIEIARGKHAEHRAGEEIFGTVRGPNSVAERGQHRAQAGDGRPVRWTS